MTENRSSPLYYWAGLVVTTVILFVCTAFGTGKPEGDWLLQSFESGRTIFYETVCDEILHHPDRAELSDTETAKVMESSKRYPRLYGILINLYYQKEEPIFDALREHDTSESRSEFAARFRDLAAFAARNFVRSLFIPGLNSDYIRKIHPAFHGKDRVDLVILSTGYQARLDPPTSPEKTVERSPEFDKQWGLDAGRFREAHTLTQGEGARIAVLYSGIDTTHPIFSQTGFGTHFALVGRDGPPWKTDAPLVDWGWHGTIVSSIVARYAPGARLTLYKAMDSDTMNNAPYPLILIHCMAACIYKAVHDGNNVINISAGVGTDTSYLREACRYAWENNVMIVAASPYYLGRYMGYHINFPGGYPTTISVTGIERREDGSLGYWPIAAPEATTTIGAPCAPFVAYPTYVPEKDEYAPGISCATPIVTAALGLIMSKYPRTGGEPPGAYFEEIKRILIETADPRILGYMGFTPECGYGLVNAVEAVRAAEHIASDRTENEIP